MEDEKQIFDQEYSDEAVAYIKEVENRYYQEVTISKVTGNCPYGHKEGEKYRVTSLNNDGLCGSLYHALHAPYTEAARHQKPIVVGQAIRVFRPVDVFRREPIDPNANVVRDAAYGMHMSQGLEHAIVRTKDGRRLLVLRPCISGQMKDFP